MKNYYDILGVQKNATQEEVSKAFHRLAKKYHPDRPGGDSRLFKEINEAYQVLSNKEKRTQYDRFGKVFEGGQPGFDFSSGQQFWQDFRGFDFGEGGFGGLDLDEIFGEMFGSGYSQTGQERTKRGRNIAVDIEIDLEETLFGKDKEINVPRFVTCPQCRGRGAEMGSKIIECKTCRGSGKVRELHKIMFGTITRMAPCPNCVGEGKIIEDKCKECTGEGRIKSYEKLKVRIPAGVANGDEIRYQGMGDSGKRDGPSGDLFVRVFVREHPLFTREGDNVFIKIPISFSQAALGAKIEAPTLEGPVILKIPPGTDSGKIFRLSRKGIPRTSGYGRGDELVEIFVKTPKNLTKEQAKLIEELRKEEL